MVVITTLCVSKTSFTITTVCKGCSFCDMVTLNVRFVHAKIKGSSNLQTKLRYLRFASARPLHFCDIYAFCGFVINIKNRNRTRQLFAQRSTVPLATRLIVTEAITFGSDKAGASHHQYLCCGACHSRHTKNMIHIQPTFAVPRLIIGQI